MLEETGLLPHANAGALGEAELERAPGGEPVAGDDDRVARRPARTSRAVRTTARPTRPRRAAWRRSRPRAGPRIPFTTGILVGIGETRAERLDALLAIRAAHERHGHVQEVIVQNFLPKPGTKMHDAPAVRARGAACARSRSPGSCSAGRCTSRRRRTSPTPTDLGDLVAAGIDDWGGVSPLTADHVNPERPWPALDALRAATEAAGKVLAPRLTVYPEYVARRRALARSRGALPGAVRVRPRRACARDDAWASGGDTAAADPAPPSTPACAGGPVGEVLDGVRAARRSASTSS